MHARGCRPRTMSCCPAAAWPAIAVSTTTCCAPPGAIAALARAISSWVANGSARREERSSNCLSGRERSRTSRGCNPPCLQAQSQRRASPRPANGCGAVSVPGLPIPSDVTALRAIQARRTATATQPRDDPAAESLHGHGDSARTPYHGATEIKRPHPARRNAEPRLEIGAARTNDSDLMTVWP